MSEIFSFEVRVDGTDWVRIINERTAGKARRSYYNDLIDAWPDVPFTALRCRKIGGPHTSERFRSTARDRGIPSLKCGQRVTVMGNSGTIVGHNEAANFVVIFDDESPQYGGATLSVHPQDIMIESEEVAG